MQTMVEDVAKYLNDLTRAGCRVTITPRAEPFDAVEIKAERLNAIGETVAGMVQYISREELDETCLDGLPLAFAIRDIARGLAESI